MSTITLNSNLASLRAQRSLSQHTSALGRSFERLSSGLRINRASDDAAGLAVAAGLEADRRVHAQGVRNLNDGVGLLNVAEGALQELSGIVVRIRELATQAANGTLGHEQRQALDAEAQALAGEYARIARTTEFNGRKLFDGDFGELTLQAGYGELGGITSGLGGAIGDGTFKAALSFAVGTLPLSVSSGDLNGDGILDLVTADSTADSISVLLGVGDGSFETAISHGVGDTPRSVVLGDFNGDGVLDLATSDQGDSTISVLIGSGDGGFGARTSFATGNAPESVSAADLNGDGKLDLITTNQVDDNISIFLGIGDGSFSSATSYAAGDSPRSPAIGDFNGDGQFDLATADFSADSVSVLLGRADGSFGSATSFGVGSTPRNVIAGDFNGDGILDLVTSHQGDDTVGLLLGTGDGGFGSLTTFTVGDLPVRVASADFNGDGLLDLVASNVNDNNLSVLLAAGDGSFAAATSFHVGNGPRTVTAGDFNGDGVPDLVSADGNDNTISVLLGNTTDGVAPLLPFSLEQRAEAEQAMAQMDQALDRLSLQRGTVGAFQSRVASALSTISATVDNLAAAESQIRDADIAEEAANLVRNRILQQAAAAVLAQANQAPALALRLIGSTG